MEERADDDDDRTAGQLGDDRTRGPDLDGHEQADLDDDARRDDDDDELRRLFAHGLPVAGMGPVRRHRLGWVHGLRGGILVQGEQRVLFPVPVGWRLTDWLHP